MIYGIDVDPGRADFLKANHVHRRKHRLHDQLRPETGEAVQDAAIFVEKTEWDGDNAEHHCVHPDEGIENEVGAQAAQHAIFFLRHG